jgi:hypothetical protein
MDDSSLFMLARQVGKAQSLGDLSLTPGTEARSSGNAQPAEQTLRFDLPPSAVIREFNELRIVFHLKMARAYRSANVAVERFYLVPRGS